MELVVCSKRRHVFCVCEASLAAVHLSLAHVFLVSFFN